MWGFNLTGLTLLPVRWGEGSMITTALLGMVNTLISWFCTLRPVWAPVLPPGIADLVAFCKYYDDILPITETTTCITLAGSLLVAFLTVKWGVKIVDWIADVIP